MNRSWSRILIPFSRHVTLSKIARLFFAIASTSRCLISITLRCASAIVYTYVACCTFNDTFVDKYSSFATTFSSLASFCTICASTKWCSSTSSSSNSSMHTRSTTITPSPIYSLAHKCRLLLCKKSIIDVPIIFMFWIIICANYIFSLYVFLSTHSEDDDECGDNLTTNGKIFNIPFLSALFNSLSTSIFLKNFASSCCLHLCSLLYISFSLAIHYKSSIALYTLILLWIPKL